MPAYSEAYYGYLEDGALRSARAVVPLLLDFVRPRRVIDIGCGLGTWLTVFEEHGAAEIQGVDGPWVDRERLHIPQDAFIPANLEAPFQTAASFDLVVSLEVAEHLPPDCAEQFVETLVGLGPVVLFSAAAPLQGGDHHVNERWPAYWAAHFQRKGYVAIDCLRQRLWHSSQIEWWYAQNALFFVRENCLEDYPALKREHTGSPPLPMVHPRCYLELQERVAQLRGRADELGAWGVELQKQVEALCELRPGHVSLLRVLRALPALVKHALAQSLKNVA